MIDLLGMLMIGKRLREARRRCGMSQEKLGIEVGLDATSAKQRIYQYEMGIYSPRYQLACQFAHILDVPECYFYIMSDDFAVKVLDLYFKDKLEAP